jgi:hypothetical protein
VRFAVDLFDVDESNIAPGSPETIAALGRGGPSASPTPSGPPGSPSGSPELTPGPDQGGPVTPAVGRARDELWVPVVLIVLAVLLVEYAVYQRDALIRIWRAATGRLRGGPGAA